MCNASAPNCCGQCPGATHELTQSNSYAKSTTDTGAIKWVHSCNRPDGHAQGIWEGMGQVIDAAAQPVRPGHIDCAAQCAARGNFSQLVIERKRFLIFATRCFLTLTVRQFLSTLVNRYACRCGFSGRWHLALPAQSPLRSRQAQALRCPFSRCGRRPPPSDSLTASHPASCSCCRPTRI